VTPAPFHAALADGPPGAVAVWVQSGAARIRLAWWKAGSKGTVLLLPGRTECIEKYGRAAADLTARGYSVITIDWRGQGLADRSLPDRLMGHVGDFAEYQQDLDALVAEARRADLPEPFHMIAHSMGGCIGLRGLMRGVPVRSAVFSAPMFGISMAAWLRPVAVLVGALSAPLGLGARYAPTTGPQSYLQQVPFLGNVLTSDREMWDYMLGQVRGCQSLRWVVRRSPGCTPRCRNVRPCPCSLRRTCPRSVRWGRRKRWWTSRRSICGWRAGRKASWTFIPGPSTRS